MAKIFLTGGTGFVGYHLINEAIKRGYEVYVAVRQSSKIEHLKDLPIKFVYPNFKDISSLTEELKKQPYDYIIHAAAATRAPNQNAFNEANADITRNIAIAALQSSIPLKKFVFLSSLALLGPVPFDTKEPIKEYNEPHPITGYGRSKLLAEQYLQEFNTLPLIILRPTVVYGPREKDLYVMFRTLAKGFEPYIGRKNQILSFVYVADLVAVILDALTLDTPYGLTCNISDGNAYNRSEISTITKKILGKKTLKLHVPVSIVKIIASAMETLYSRSKKQPLLYKERVGELTAPNWNCSIEQAKKYLHYQPKYNLERGVTETIKWYKENGWL